MDFTPTETQAAVRGVAEDVLDRDPASWKALAAAGLLAVPVPEEYGGEGLGFLETSVLLHETGRRAAGGPLWDTLACAVPTLVAHGTDAQKQALLPDVASGACVLSAALVEAGHGIPAVPSTTLRLDGERLLLTGRKLAVGHLDEARRVLVPARLETPEGPVTVVVLLDPASAGVSVLATRASRGADCEATLVLEDVVVAPDDVVGGLAGAGATGAATGAAATLRRHAVAGLCLLGDGVVAGARDLTAGYVKERRQFGRALAEFQAVSAQMADVYIASRTIGLAATSAAWRLATGRDPDEDLAVASYWFTVEGPAALHTCHHLHGGMGVDVTYPLHAYFSWAKDIARALGGTQVTLDAVAARTEGRD